MSSFAELVSDMQRSCFDELGESATYTPPGVGAVPLPCRAMIDEPNLDPFERTIPGARVVERSTSVWLFRAEIDTSVRDGVVQVVTSHGITRSLRLVSLMHRDPDRVQWAAREVEE